MIEDKEILGIIPARGGSKGVQRKNIRSLYGKPLIAYTIEAALTSKYIDKLIVSTDDEEIATISRKYGAEVPFMRPKELALDSASSEDVIMHTLDWVEKNMNIRSDVFILLQPTSPLRTSKHIDEAIELFNSNKNANTLYSVVKLNQIPSKVKRIDENGFLKNTNTNYPHVKRRQDSPKIYYPNGAIYISKVDYFIKYKSFDESLLIPFVMNKFESVDIDDELDFKIAAILIQNY